MFPPPAKGYTKPATKRNATGFTLIELLVAIAVAVIMATWAVPGFQAFAARSEINAEVMRIRTALALARNTAITRRTIITVCPSVDRLTCSNEDWTAPLVVIEGRAKGGNISDSEVLKVFDGSHAESITYRKDGRPVRYGMLGWPAGHNGTFGICMEQGKGKQLIVSNLGRLSVKDAQTCH